MIDQHVSPVRDVVHANDADVPRDRLMDALQYGIAILAIVVAIVLASIR
jgi:hypothetical protein